MFENISRNTNFNRNQTPSFRMPFLVPPRYTKSVTHVEGKQLLPPMKQMFTVNLFHVYIIKTSITPINQTENNINNIETLLIYINIAMVFPKSSRPTTALHFYSHKFYCCTSRLGLHLTRVHLLFPTLGEEKNYITQILFSIIFY